MEFFREIHRPDLDVAHMKRKLTIGNLTQLCASVNTATECGENKGDIYCLWGAFSLTREEIRYGVRFSLLNCPHALAWTVTFNEDSQNIIIHCTIDKTETDPDFVESIHEFVEDWSKGLAAALQ